MPRKSAAAIAAASDAAPSSPMQTHEQIANGDVSVLSAPGEISVKTPRISTGKHDGDAAGIDDLLLPRTLTSRLARGILPANTSIQKDALLALTKSATVFISALAATANEQTSKKTIGPQDVLKALKEMELDQLMGIGQIGQDGKAGGRLERELEMWETSVKGKRKGYREKIKARESGGVDGEGMEDEERGEPDAKKVRMDEDDESAVDGRDVGDMGPPATQQRLSLSLGRADGNENGNGHASTTNGNGQDMLEPSDEEQVEDDQGEEDVDGDETESVDDDEEEEEEVPEESGPEEFGPDEQLRQEVRMNGNGQYASEDESD